MYVATFFAASKWIKMILVKYLLYHNEKNTTKFILTNLTTSLLITLASALWFDFLSSSNLVLVFASRM